MKTWQQLVVVLLAGMILTAGIFIVSARPRGTPVELLPIPTAAPVLIDIGGEVQNPGTYILLPGSRVENAVETAGGLLPSADRDLVNMAALLSDGEKITIPAVGEQTVSNPDGSVTASEKSAAAVNDLHINLNTATLEELMLLPGIGETRALAIIEYRNIHGGFRSIDEIQEVQGIGEEIFGRIKNFIALK